jgi:hypothetical protein
VDTQTVEPSAQSAAFENIVKQSAEKLTPGATPQAAPVKQKRPGNPGGPRGAYKRRKKFSKRIPLSTPAAQLAPSQSVDAPTPEQSQQHAGAPNVNTATPMPHMKQLIVAPLKIISRIPARKYKINELALDDTEAGELADSLDQMLQVFIPDLGAMSPKTAAVFNVGIVASTLIISKYKIYSEKRAEIELKTQENELKPELNQELINNKNEPDLINPTDYFKPRQSG